MRYKILCNEKTDDALLYALNKLPKGLRTCIKDFLSRNNFSQINEIRLHDSSYVTFIADSKNITTDILLKNGEISEIINNLCNGSIYAHFDTIKEGYISVGMGIRAGICGRATVVNGDIDAICDITSINIRLPKRIFHSADYLYKILKENNFSKSIIIYSRPGVGKTTILRELIYLISKNDIPIRNAVIDSREEITPFMDRSLISSDVFISYPKGIAIEMATKAMNPEVIICDEISSQGEADAILKSSNSGVKLIATTHASSFEELCSKKILKELFLHKVFDLALGVERQAGSKKYEFHLSTLNGVSE